MERPTPDRVVDSRGTYCPVPIVETAKAVRELAPGQVLLVLATDPGVESDLQYWCKSTKHEYLGLDREGAEFRGWVRVRGRPPVPSSGGRDERSPAGGAN